MSGRAWRRSCPKWTLRYSPRFWFPTGIPKDGTAEYARELGCDVYLQEQKGIRHSYIEAWPMIRGDYVITFSPDGNCPPEDLPRLKIP